MAGLSKRIHRGKEILYFDYQGLNEAQMIDLIKQAEALILSENKPVLQLTNIKNAFATPGFMSVVREAGEKTKHLTTKSAIVGISGAKKILLGAYNAIVGGVVKPFDNEDDALDYLVK